MQLTIIQYIYRFNLCITRRGVLWRIDHNIPLDFVIKIERIGRSYVLTVNS